MIASVNPPQIQKLGAFLRSSDACAPFDWTGDGFPAAGAPQALDFFFLAVKHQFGFWYGDGEKYLEPMYAEVGGRRFKGSDFIWQALSRAARERQDLFDLESQSALSGAEVLKIFSDDSGRCPLPDPDSHVEIFRGAARDWLDNGLTPSDAVARAMRSARPLAALLETLKSITGYKEDPLAKKAVLLGMVLANRPEAWLKPGAGESFPPVVDYHIQRSALRTGLVTIEDASVRKKVESRRLLSEPEESAIRQTVYDALLGLSRASHKDLASIDWLLFQTRRYCPEMTDPDCEACVLRQACPRLTQMFQPVRRTTYY